MLCDPYIVIGTGRSGTSTVARVLCEEMNVFMGNEFRKPDKNNPSGYWEDVEFAGPNWRLLNGKTVYPKWVEEVFSVIDSRMKLGVHWGFKDPDATHFLGLYLSFFKTPKIIRCSRDRELVVKSLMRCFRHERKLAESIFDMKELALDNILAERDHLVVNFSEQLVGDESIANAIREKWECQKS